MKNEKKGMPLWASLSAVFVIAAIIGIVLYCVSSIIFTIIGAVAFIVAAVILLKICSQ